MYYAELKQARAELSGPGSPLEVHEIEVRGQSLLAYKNAPPTIRDFWLSTVAFADRDYIVYEDERLTYGQAHDKVASIAAWIAAQGIKRGDRIAIGMRNYPEWMLIYWASLCLGVAVVGLNAWWVSDELEFALEDSAPKILFVDTERLARIAERPGMAKGIKVVAIRTANIPAGVTPWAEVQATASVLPGAAIDPDDDACIFYTSGTTGRPKGAQLTHRSCIANLFNMVFAGQAQNLAIQRATNTPAPNPESIPWPTALLTTPLFHVTANNCGAYATTAGGGAIVLMYKWDAGDALKLIAREKVTAMSGVPMMSRELITHPDFSKYDLSSLLSLGGGGAQLQPDLVAKIDSSVATARPNTGYGMTETSGIITSISGDFFIDRPDSAGPPVATLIVKVVDDGGNTLPVGAVGELWVKGSPVIKGYINRPEATASTIVDGWLQTGDVARLDEEGFIYIVDRKKDMVLRGGENVYCAEVESCIFRHDAVAECCVFGVPDDRLGEEVAVAVVLHPGASLTADALREHCAGLIAKHKAPRYVWFMEEALPRNASGKFLKRELRETLSTQTAG